MHKGAKASVTSPHCAGMQLDEEVPKFELR